MSGCANLLHKLLLLQDGVLALSDTNFFSNVGLEDVVNEFVARKVVIVLLVLSSFVYCTLSTILIINKMC
jgi:hypothetical protein